MIISIRYVKGHWHYEVYGVKINFYASGIAPDWATMIAALEVHVSELEKKDEQSKR